MSNLELVDLVKAYIQDASHIMWFMGAGVPRTAGMPTATDIIWDLKRTHYCRQENQDIKLHDIHNESIKAKIQAYFDSRGCPQQWSPEEYSFFFDLVFGKDYEAQQIYLQQQLHQNKISLNIGHRVLAALLHLGLTKTIFTTNFDTVIETAYAEISGKTLNTFHLEGSYAALQAFNVDNFPLYAKLHGDFRFQSVKNLKEDLLNNDKEIEKCFLTASNRFGLIVTGYSGRDKNVMDMFHQAIETHNPFPKGFFWTVTQKEDTAPQVIELINKAQKKRIKAHIVETGTFDIMMSRIWRQLTQKTDQLDQKVKAGIRPTQVAIPLPQAGRTYPILRTNALPIVDYPLACLKITSKEKPSIKDLKDKIFENNSPCIMTITSDILAWGAMTDITKILDKDQITSVDKYEFEKISELLEKHTVLRSFYEEAIVKALCLNKPILSRWQRHKWYLIVDHNKLTSDLLTPLKVATKNRYVNQISSHVPRVADTFWQEALNIKIEVKDNKLWLLMRPDIWVTPAKNRALAIDFLSNRKKDRYNNKSNNILDAWIKLLFSNPDANNEVTVSCFNTAVAPNPAFKINVRSAASMKEVVNV